jgi:hypothetical protein
MKTPQSLFLAHRSVFLDLFDANKNLIYSGMLPKDGSLTLPPASPRPATGRL